MLRATPQSLARTGEEFVSEIMQVCALAVEQITEFSGVHHAQHQRLVVPVTAVLKHGAVLARRL